MLSALEQFAPLPLQESWDNAGLQIGLTEAEVSGALLCLDVTEKVIDEAIAKGCNLVVSHHPLLFRGLKQVSDANDVQRTVRKAIKADICVISMHTNMDNAQGGVNFKIAERLGAQIPAPCYPLASPFHLPCMSLAMNRSFRPLLQVKIQDSLPTTHLRPTYNLHTTKSLSPCRSLAVISYISLREYLIPLKDVTSIYLLSYVIKTGVIAVRNNRLALSLELLYVVYDKAAKEGLSIGNGGFVNNDLSTLGLDALHNALNSTLTEIVGIALHREAINTDDTFLLTVSVPLAAAIIIACLTKYFISNEVLTGAVALYNGSHHILRHISIVGQQLLGVFWQAVATIAKAWVIIMGTDTRV